MSMDSLYQEIILDHARSPHGAGLRQPFDVEVHHVNPTCGDEVRLRARLDGDGVGPWVVADVSYETMGCSISTAGTSVMTDLVTGVHVHDALARYDEVLTMLQTRDGTPQDSETLGDAVAFAGVAKFPARVKCALLGWTALRDALSQAAAAHENGRTVPMSPAPATISPAPISPAPISPAPISRAPVATSTEETR